MQCGIKTESSSKIKKSDRYVTFEAVVDIVLVVADSVRVVEGDLYGDIVHRV